ncbi:MAG: cellulase family glycosylhydrolase [Chloroflexota bacterium]|nr:cellulase family glycosylhydrolase [Chloroflexota bacterium]
MFRIMKMRKIGVIIFILLGVNTFWLQQESLLLTAYASSSAPKLSATSNLVPHDTFAQGPYKVHGNTILNASGQPYMFHGVALDSFEYTCQKQDSPPIDSQSLSYMGSGINTSSTTYWDGNTVRLPLSEEFWLYGNTKLNPSQSNMCTASQYQAKVKQTVDRLTALKLNVILDLHFSDAGGQWYQNGGSQWAMPDADSVSFWKQIASLYSTYTNALFELFNEPHPSSWQCWLETCHISDDNDGQGHTVKATYTSPGMQLLTDTIRGTGAKNVVIIGGTSFGYNLSMLGKTDKASITYIIKGPNVVYSTHPYPYGGKLASNWDADFGIGSKTYPILTLLTNERNTGMVE